MHPGKKAVAVPPPVEAKSPFDLAFGAKLATDYNFRGVSQSDRGPSVGAYAEGRYNDLIYVGIAGASVDLPTQPSAEIDLMAGIRPTLGPSISTSVASSTTTRARSSSSTRMLFPRSRSPRRTPISSNFTAKRPTPSWSATPSARTSITHPTGWHRRRRHVPFGHRQGGAALRLRRFR